MIRVVIDTNVVISALLAPEGFEDRVLKLALHRYIQLYVSAPILDEYGRVLHSAKFRFTKAQINRIIRGIREAANQIHPMRRLTKCHHEQDNRFLECAEAAGADFLVTGNARHFPRQYKTIEVVSSRRLVELLAIIRIRRPARKSR